MKEELINLINKHSFLSLLPRDQVENGILTLEKHFSDKYEFFGEQVFITVRRNDKYSYAMNILDDLLPALIIAHRYFGKDLPSSLIQKLLNKSQTVDTIFELKCMGIFLAGHKVSYEPKLKSGKVPEFKISPVGFPDVYVECKSQNQQDSKYLKKFNMVSSKLMNALNVSTFLKDAWSNNYRTEVFPSRYIHDAEIKELVCNLEKLKFLDVTNIGKLVTRNILVVCIPREQEPRNNEGIRVGSITVGDKPVQLSYTNTHLMINAWNSINIQTRRSQRDLFREARRKLKDIPKDCLGMICIQTYGALRFLLDIQKLLSQKEYASTPIAWLNPFHEGKIICHNEFINLRECLFSNFKVNK